MPSQSMVNRVSGNNCSRRRFQSNTFSSHVCFIRRLTTVTCTHTCKISQCQTCGNTSDKTAQAIARALFRDQLVKVYTTQETLKRIHWNGLLCFNNEWMSNTCNGNSFKVDIAMDYYCSRRSEHNNKILAVLLQEMYVRDVCERGLWGLTFKLKIFCFSCDHDACWDDW